VSAWPVPDYSHLLRMSDGKGTFEHAEFAEPRGELGYCTDDMARVLVVAAREANPTEELRALTELSLGFVGRAQAPGGARNRLDRRGRWTDGAAVADCWGRSLWGLGTAAARSDVERIRITAISHFRPAARLRSPWIRAMAFAAVGASELLVAHPDHEEATMLLLDAADRMPSPARNANWPWPEARLTYANAVIPEAMIAAAAQLGRPALLQQGLDLLGWLLDHETLGGHLSPTPAGGAGLGDGKPGYDQQPIEVAALADACARAAAADGDSAWTTGRDMAMSWFLGDNDGGQVMWDASTGGGFDGLEADGRNENQGAESTLAALATMQYGQQPVAGNR
jgi:hypothetical protein